MCATYLIVWLRLRISGFSTITDPILNRVKQTANSLHSRREFLVIGSILKKIKQQLSATAASRLQEPLTTRDFNHHQKQPIILVAICT